MHIHHNMPISMNFPACRWYLLDSFTPIYFYAQIITESYSPSSADGWQSGREIRVDSWRNFATGRQKRIAQHCIIFVGSKKGPSGASGIKPPKLKTEKRT